jgi:hypothetical protein
MLKPRINLLAFYRGLAVSLPLWALIIWCVWRIILLVRF